MGRQRFYSIAFHPFLSHVDSLDHETAASEKRGAEKKKKALQSKQTFHWFSFQFLIQCNHHAHCEYERK